jgi:predicted phosphatase
MNSLIEKIGLKPLLNLPDSIWKKINSISQLDLNAKYVLATLYYLDSKDKMSSLKTRLPHYTYLSWKDCERALKLLAHLDIIEYREGRVFLRIKPLKYKGVKHAKKTRY